MRFRTLSTLGLAGVAGALGLVSADSAGAVSPAPGATYVTQTCEVTKEGTFCDRFQPRVSFTVSRGGHRVLGLASSGNYGEPGRCGGIRFTTGARSDVPTIRIVKGGRFQGRRHVGSATVTVSGRFTGSGRVGQGKIHWRDPKSKRSSGCNFDVRFVDLHALPSLPHGAPSPPRASGAYRGTTIQGEAVTLGVSPDAKTVQRLDVTLDGACHAGENFHESFFQLGVPVASDGSFSFAGTFADAGDKATAQLSGSGRFAAQGRVLRGTLRVRLLDRPQSDNCDSGQVSFSARG